MNAKSIRGKPVAGLDLFVLYYIGQIFLVSLPNQLCFLFLFDWLWHPFSIQSFPATHAHTFEPRGMSHHKFPLSILS